MAETSNEMAALASRVLRATRDGPADPELDHVWLFNSARRLAGSVLGQDETPGHRGMAKRPGLVPTPDDTQVIVRRDAQTVPVVHDRSPEWWDGFWQGLWQRQRG